MGERESPKSQWDTGVSDHATFKLDHLKPVELILFEIFHHFYFILGGLSVSDRRERTVPSLLNGQSLLLYHYRSNFLLPQREEGMKEQALKMGKRESPKSEWDTGVSVLGAFKLDHLQPVEPILSQKFSTFLPSYWEVQFLNPPDSQRARERGKKVQGLRKGYPSKVNETQVFFTLDPSNWNIVSLFNWFTHTSRWR